MLLLDVSSYQGECDFRRAKKAMPKLVGVWVKATQGTGYVNPYLHVQTGAARLAGLRVGFYHYADPDSNEDAAYEASFFARTVSALTWRNDLKPVLDSESWEPRLTPAEQVMWARHWNAGVKAKLNAGPMFYSYAAFINRLAPKTPIGYGLWLAAYSHNDGKEYPYAVPAPWVKAVAHQFTSQGRVPGIGGPVDVTFASALTPILAHPITGRV